MSGGRFDYADERARQEIFAYSDGWFDALEDMEISELVWDVFNLIHVFDWYKSGDTAEEAYKEAKRVFKEKWFKNREERLVRYALYVRDKAKRDIDEIFLGYAQKEDGKEDTTPTADVQKVKHGKWKTELSYFVCPRCGFAPGSTRPYRYCPMCGLKMDEKEKEE